MGTGLHKVLAVWRCVCLRACTHMHTRSGEWEWRGPREKVVSLIYLRWALVIKSIIYFLLVWFDVTFFFTKTQVLLKPVMRQTVHLARDKRDLRGSPSGSDAKRSTCQCRRCTFDPWVGKIPWRREWQPLQCFCLKNSTTEEPGGL